MASTALILAVGNALMGAAATVTITRAHLAYDEREGLRLLEFRTGRRPTHRQ